MPNDRIRAGVKPVPTLSARVHADQPIAKAVVAYTKPRMAAYLDEYARNPFRFDEITPSDALWALALTKVLTDNQQHLDTYTAGVGKVLADATFYSEILQFAMLFERTFADAITAAEVSTRQVGLNKADAQALSDAISAFVGKVLNDAPTLLDAQTKALGKVFADPVFQAEVLEFAAAFMRDFADAVAATDNTMSLTYAALKADAVTAGEACMAALDKVLEDTQGLTDTIAKGVTLPFADSTFYAEMLEFSTAFLRSFADSVAPADEVNRFDVATVWYDNPVVVETKAVVFTTSFSDSFSLVDLFGLLHLRDFFDDVYTEGFGSAFGSAALNVAGLNEMVGGDTVDLAVLPTKSDASSAVDTYEDVVQYNRNFVDAQPLSDRDDADIGKVSSDAAVLTDNYSLANVFARSQNDANIVAETYMLIQTTSTQTVPATLNRSALNSLPLNKEGTIVTTSTVQVV